MKWWRKKVSPEEDMQIQIPGVNIRVSDSNGNVILSIDSVSAYHAILYGGQTSMDLLELWDGYKLELSPRIIRGVEIR